MGIRARGKDSRDGEDQEKVGRAPNHSPDAPVDPARIPKPLLLVAIGTALAAGLGAGTAILLDGTVGTIAGISGAAALAALVAPTLAHRLVARPIRQKTRAANERVASARRELHAERTERGVLRELDKALDNSTDERAAIAVVREAFGRNFKGRPMELHLVDPIDPVLVLAATAGDFEHVEPQRTSPWDSLAARTNTTLVYETTDRLDACSHLRGRLHRPMSAVAVPLNATGHLLGVLYALGPEGQVFADNEIGYLEDVAALVAGRVAVIRSSTGGRRSDAIDRLTGLPDRGAMQTRVIRLLEERQAFTVAVADIDRFGEFNVREGNKAGDHALQMLAQVSRRVIRPDDVVGRIGGDEVLFVLPRTGPDDATRALERLREELTLNQSASDVPPFTLSIGVVGSTSGGTIEEILQRAAGALNHARSNGGNRVVVAKVSAEQG